jgi:hypothetical protein
MQLLQRKDYRFSFFDGMCAHVYGTLISGVFLTGFALYLHLSEFMIGLLAAIPALVTLFQLPGSYYICRNGGRKKVAYRAAAAARLLWLPLLAVGLLPVWGQTASGILFVAIYLVSHAFAQVSYLAWISWTSDLVPDEIRGTFFGKRNMLCGIAGMAAVLIFGNLVDIFKQQLGRSDLAVAVPILAAVIFGMLSLHYMNRISESAPAPEPANGVLQKLAGPFKEMNFRRFLVFAFSWNFSIFFAAPFFALYYLRDLNYSYGFVALLTTVGAVLDLVGMRVWGSISDRVKNKAVIRLAGWGVVFLPALWVVVRPADVLIPIMLQVVSGGFWSGVNLCTHNLLLRLSPQAGKVWFISAYSIIAGLGAALAPIIGGVLLTVLSTRLPASPAGGLIPLHYIFIASTVMRILSLQLLARVREPQENSLRQMLISIGSFGRPNPVLRLHAALRPFLLRSLRRTGK